MAHKITQKDYDAKVAELTMLQQEGREEMGKRIAEARSHGDLSENSEYDEARNDQAIMEARIAELQAILSDIVIVSEDEKGIHVGSVVELVDIDSGDTETYRIIGDDEKISDDDDCISIESPVGKALEGKEIGEEIEVEIPDGVIRFRVNDIK